MATLDRRIVTVGIEVNGQLKTYTDLQITAVGIKFANANMNQCELVIENLDKATQDYILTQTSLFNLNTTPKILTLYAGRESYGTSLVYLGNIMTSIVTQPPDVKIILKCLTSGFLKGNLTAWATSTGATLAQICEVIAGQLHNTLDFQAQNKQIGNYSYTGEVLGQVELLNQLASINAYIDDNLLVIKQSDLPLDAEIKIVNIDTGMIGIPEITEHGVKVRFLVDNQTKLGGRLRIKSLMYPAVDGDYIIYKLGFEITSRDVPFYYVAECKRLV